MTSHQVEAALGGRQVRLTSAAPTLPPAAIAALERLAAGHERWRSGCVLPRAFDRERQRRLAQCQQPCCAVVYCSDSRVPVEVILDAEAGEVFGVRNAGNTARSRQALGSIEYAAAHLRVPLVLVLGHTRCGAVTAACKGLIEGNITEIMADLAPAVRAARARGPRTEEELVRLAVEENVRHTMGAILGGSPTVRSLVGRGAVAVVGGLFDLEAGALRLEL